MQQAVGYVRCSTGQQANEGVSIDVQREKIVGYCEYRGLALADVIEDAGISGGTNKGRPGFLELLGRIEQGEVDVVILFSLERLSRDMLTLLALERYLDEHDVELHTVEGQVDTSSPDGFMAFAMKSFIGEMERRQTRFRTRLALKHKRARGQVTGGIPYGYRREGKELVPDLNEQAIIRKANDLYHGQGLKLAAIVQHLHEKGHRTRTGRPWAANQVRKLIQNYQGSFTKGNRKVSAATRTFIEALG
jgi:site-specific DNA recombinase